MLLTRGLPRPAGPARQQDLSLRPAPSSGVTLCPKGLKMAGSSESEQNRATIPVQLSFIQLQLRMDSVAKALEEVLTSALPQGAITVGVYEAAKSLNVDPDNVVLCVLATDEDEVKDVALQIHFTLIQAFCCENDINILRVNSTRRLAQILAGGGKQSGGEPLDLHCVLVSSPHSTSWKDPALSKLSRFCRESRGMDQWVPIINLPER
ncbi:hypothetical protein OJAV_G00167090 [Oryzias javanicus]|uniref:Growth arrest and DNA damage-inducible protein GADD45 alpha n=1 Tax=Oryzias javanicus TaxID=123683 RepID=A0A437CE17_ORYJA|nr:hypothetical protein OJAV_G00167090 [Oryzias javanicus]